MTKVSGKGYRNVPILFTSDMEAALEILLATRETAGVCATNVYLFAIPNTVNSFINFYKTMREMAEVAKINHPELVTSTRLRKYAASTFQVTLLN